MSERMAPVLLSVKGMRIIVFGGGPVALRKCLHFQGAQITVVAPETVSGIEEYDVIRMNADPQNAGEMMDGYDMVIAATGDKELNITICGIAKGKGILANSAHGGGTVVIPSVLRRDDYVVSVSTEGRVPAFPPYVIEELDSMLDDRFDLMYRILSETREMISGRRTQPERSQLLKDITNDDKIRSALFSRDIECALLRAREMEERF